VVAYDVADDRRRARLASTLEDYGVRVQYSVFECLIDDRRLEELRRRAAAILDPSEDRIAYYRLCPRCGVQSGDRHEGRRIGTVLV
jgi:CRISPR-associated protein Cas2